MQHESTQHSAYDYFVAVIIIISKRAEIRSSKTLKESSKMSHSIAVPRGTAVLKLTTVIILRGEIHVILISRDYGA